MSAKPHWSTSEDAILREKYATVPNSVLVNDFVDRDAGSLRLRASRLGLKKNKVSYDLSHPFTGCGIDTMTEQEKAYLAGIIDGEGCLRLSKSSRPNNKCAYHISIVIANTSVHLFDWLNVRIPGKMYTSRQNHEKWRGCYHWTLTGTNQCLYFLKQIEPYLVIKKEQAQVLMNGYVHLSNNDREDMVRKLKDLKRTC